MKSRIIVDTGPLVALLNKPDHAHTWVMQQMADAQPPLITCEAVLAEAETLYDRWPTMPTGDKRKIAEALVERIVIGEGEIDIMFSYLPTSEELCKNQQQLRGLG